MHFVTGRNLNLIFRNNIIDNVINIHRIECIQYTKEYIVGESMYKLNNLGRVK